MDKDEKLLQIGIEMGKIKNKFDELQKENKQLKDNWDKLKEYIRKTKLNEFEKSYGKRYSKTFTQAEVIICNIIISHMQKLEEGEK